MNYAFAVHNEFYVNITVCVCVCSVKISTYDNSFEL